MRRRPKVPSLLAPLLALAAPPVAAQERPLLQPSRDVAVTYRVTSGEATGRSLQMAWLAGARKLRVEAPGMQGFSVIDQKAQRMLLVMERERAVVEVPPAAGGTLLPTEPPANARFTRGGSATIAGLACTVWRYEDGQARGETCLTADGVMLRSSGTAGERSGTVEAVSVAYGRQDPARFEAPAGFRSLALPPGAVQGAPRSAR